MLFTILVVLLILALASNFYPSNGGYPYRRYGVSSAGLILILIVALIAAHVIVFT